jgi:hypothetical protein
MSHTLRMNFTKTALAALPPAPPGRRLVGIDTKTHGLILQVTGPGVKTFYVRRKIAGRSE